MEGLLKEHREVIIYKAKQGDSIEAIGLIHHISAKTIRMANPKIGHTLFAGDIIVLPLGKNQECLLENNSHPVKDESI